jgi:hypothetical protein
LEPTTAAGLAVRVSKGFGQYLAVEGEIAGGSTGTVDFGGGMTRSATHGRLVAQAVARAGTENAFSFRLGTGLQVARYDSESQEMVGTDVDLVAALGLGFARRFGDLSLGLQFQYVQAFGTGARDMGVGLQAGYGWSL